MRHHRIESILWNKLIIRKMEFMKSINSKINIYKKYEKVKTKKIYEKYQIHSEEELSQGETETFSSVAWLRCYLF